MSKRSENNQARSLGLIAWVRRRVLPKLAKLCAFIGLAILAFWVCGRILTDQHLWSQYIWWIPPLWMLGAAWGFLVASAALAIFSRRPSGLLVRPLLLIACIGCTGYLLIGVWRVQRVVLQSPDSVDTIRIMHWNISANKTRKDGSLDWIPQAEPDIVLLANARWGKDQLALLELLSVLAPAEQTHEVVHGFHIPGKTGHFRVHSNAIIASRYPIMRTGMMTMGELVDEDSPIRTSGDRGWVFFAEIDIQDHELSTPLAKTNPVPFVIWFVDLPSDPTVWRRDSMTQVSQNIDQWNGRSFVVNPESTGKRVWIASNESQEFPKPDLVMGDFNTLRGSSSLDILAPNMIDAFERTGHGRARSWTPRVRNRFIRQPFKLADWHIDLALVNPDWNPVGYQLRDPTGNGYMPHKMQILDLVQ